MQKYIRLLFSLLVVYYLVSCNNTKESSLAKNGINEDSLNAQKGKEWFTKNIESFFNNEENFMKGFSYLCTAQYAEFKNDATNIDFDGGMTEGEFKSKWGRRYSNYAGIGEGFMIAGTDFGKIKVVKCEFKHRTEMRNFFYEVILIDQTFHSKFIREIVLIKNGDSFLIDDVREIANEFQEN